ncbi:aromatic amino acid transport protein [Yersinia pseudotuberculosis]|nr:aromatic amino acid transport protein [Yersinia pseudotuberculosis]CNC34940.1 aromatic amino acid transport protein [Yersinia pseudotuberculosis]CNC47588.1 aromatic amino acid transport protein [Yersinia pseudotuberculosis]CRY63148.1 aromatic amino acid transport protein [Yersinia pseudotuberculosis]
MSDQQEGAELKRGLKNRHIQLIALISRWCNWYRTIPRHSTDHQNGWAFGFTGVRNWGFYCVSDNAPARRNGG